MMDQIWQLMHEQQTAGIEPERVFPQPATSKELTENDNQLSALCLHGESSDCPCTASTDTMLRRLICVWPELPGSTKRAINAICVDAFPMREFSKLQSPAVNRSQVMTASDI